MASLKINIPHQLSQQEALSRIKTMFGKMKEEQKDRVKDISEDWQGNTGRFAFNVQGFDLSGIVQVNDDSVDIDGKLPMALALFKGKISDIISKQAGDLLKK